MESNKLIYLCECFIKDRSLFNNHLKNGVIDELIKTILNDISILDIIKDDDEYTIELEKEIVTLVVYLKEYYNFI